MKQYPKYKDSGIQWIGQLPEEWNAQALKYIGDARNGLTYSPMDVTDAGILVLRSSNIQDSKLAFEDNVYVKEAPDFLKMKKGDILICSRNGSLALVGKCVYIPEDMDAVFGAFMLRYRPHIPNRFIFYVVQEAIRKYKAYYATSTVNQLTVDVLGRMQIPLPPISEQESIVCYLDDKTAKIDETVNLLEQQKADLQQYRKALISQTVTRGLNPNAKLKDSGIQWIGLIPEHWNVTKTKYIARLYTGNSLDYSQKEKYLTDHLEINESAIPYIATKDISSDCNCVTYYNGLAIPKEEDGFKKAPKGSFLLCVEGGSAGRKHAYLEHEVCFVNKLCCFDSSLNSRYHYYFIQTEPFRNHFKQMIQGLIGGVSVSDLNNMEVVVPSDSEQQAIAQFLDSKTAKIDETIRRIDEQIADLRAYRTALISDVVTGKIDVRN